MAVDSLKQVVEDARRWIEQERVWDEALYATAQASPPATSVAVPSPDGRGKSGNVLPSPVRRGSRGAGGEVKAAALQILYEQYKDCTRCPLGNTRLKFVFGVGNPDAEVLFIGEGPGYDEDHQGEPFIGRAGKLLDQMIESIGLSRKSVYIANIVKCHAMIHPDTPHERGNDRAPTTLESETCSPILQQQIAIITPRIIVTLGSPSTRSTLGTQEGISKIRGRLFPLPMTYFKGQGAEADLFDNKKRDEFMGFSPEQLAPLSKIQVLPMYHPAALLRNPNLKKDAWEDMKLLRDTLAMKA